MTLRKKRAPVSSRFYLCLLPLPTPPLPCVPGARRIYYRHVLFSLGLFNSLPEISFNQMGLCDGAQRLTWPPSQLLTPREEGSFLRKACRHQSPPCTGRFLPLPFRGGPGPLGLDLPAFLARSREAGDFRCQPETRFRYPSRWTVNTLQVIGSCSTHQLVIKLPPGPSEEMAAGWPSSASTRKGGPVWLLILA